MTAPIHKTCYRCGAAVPEFVNPADVLGGQCGVCADCERDTAAAEALREWRWKNGVPAEDRTDPGTDIPRENIFPAAGAAGAENQEINP